MVFFGTAQLSAAFPSAIRLANALRTQTNKFLISFPSVSLDIVITYRCSTIVVNELEVRMGVPHVSSRGPASFSPFLLPAPPIRPNLIFSFNSLISLTSTRTLSNSFIYRLLQEGGIRLWLTSTFRFSSQIASCDSFISPFAY